MFTGCTSLTAAPTLLATTLAKNCYFEMFRSCSNLSSIQVAFTDWTDTEDATKYWVYEVAANGVFTKPVTLSTEFGESRIPTNWRIKDIVPLTFTAKSASNIALSTIGDPDSINLQYSINGFDNWQEYTANTIINLASGDTVSFSGNNDHFSKDANNYYNFMMTGTIEASNSVQSLMNYSDDCTSACYSNLFSGCTALTIAP